jgi:hypothetical protein
LSIRISQTQKLALAFHLLRNKLQIKTTKTNWEIYLSSFFAVESILFFTHTQKKKIDASSSFLCFVQGEKSFTLFLCSKKEEEKKNAILGKNDFELFFVPLPHGASFAQ